MQKKINSRSCVFVGSRCSVVVLKKKLEAAVKAALPHFVHVMLECLDGDQS